MNTLEGPQEWCASVKKITEKRLKWYGHVRRTKEKNARCGYTREKKKRAAKPKMERCV